MAEQDKIVDLLQELIETCRDGENGYREAAEHVSDPELRGYFNDQSTERARFAQQLQQELVRLGNSEKLDEQGSVSGRLHRAWFDLKADLGGGDKTILESVEQGEDSAKKAYEEALQEPLPENIMAIVRSQAQSVLAAHDHVKLLRDRRKAA
jgi:uncharacterized protein (TIGR02284 family)